jgi:hypothetical protein
MTISTRTRKSLSTVPTLASFRASVVFQLPNTSKTKTAARTLWKRTGHLTTHKNYHCDGKYDFDNEDEECAADGEEKQASV